MADFSLEDIDLDEFVAEGKKLLDEQKLEAARQRYGQQPPDRGLAGELWQGLKVGLGDRLPLGVAQAIRGGDVGTEKGVIGRGLDRFIEGQKEDLRNNVPSRQVVLGDEWHRAMYEGPQNTAFSLGLAASGMVAGGLGAAAATPVPHPAAKVIGGAIGAAGSTYLGMFRAARDEFVDQIYDEIGQDMQPEQWDRVRQRIDADAQKFGHAEAGPEAIANALETAFMRLPVSKFVPVDKIRNFALRSVAKVGTKLGGIAATELPTETYTAKQQRDILAEYGLAEPAGYAEAFKEVAGPTMVGSALIGGGLGMTRRIMDRQGRALAEDPDIVEVEKAGAPAGKPVAKTPDPDEPGTPDQAGRIDDEESYWQAQEAEIRRQRDEAGKVVAEPVIDRSARKRAANQAEIDRLAKEAIAAEQQAIINRQKKMGLRKSGRVAGQGVDPDKQYQEIAQRLGITTPPQTPALPAGQGFELVGDKPKGFEVVPSETINLPHEEAAPEGDQSRRDAEPSGKVDNDPKEQVGKDRLVHKHSNTQVSLPEAHARAVTEFGRRIPENEIYTDPDDDSYGREAKPHITIRYGMDTLDPAEIAPAFKDLGRIKARMGKVSVFETDKYDVVKVDIDSTDLREANKMVGETVKLPGETFKNYIPHATIAYVKKGEGKKYVGDKTFEGREVTFDHVVLSAKDGREHKIPLGGSVSKPKVSPKDLQDLGEKTEKGVALANVKDSKKSKHHIRVAIGVHHFTNKDIPGLFKKQKIIRNPDGSAAIVNTRSGKSLTIEFVDRIDENTIDWSAYGGKKPDGQTVGRYIPGKNRMQLLKGQADIWTLNHEAEHWMEDAGLIDKHEQNLLKAEIRRRHKAGKWRTLNPRDVGGREDRAEYLARRLAERRFRRDRSVIRRILQRIADFIDWMANLAGRRTASATVREVESGKIFERQAGPPPEKTEQARSLASVKPDDLKPGKDNEDIFEGIEPAGKKTAASWIRRETGAFVRTLASYRPKNLSHLTFMERVLKSPEWYEHPVMKRIVRLAVNRHDLFSETFNGLNELNNPTDSHDTVTDATQALKHKGLSKRQVLSGKTSKEYQGLLRMIDEGDTHWYRPEMKQYREGVQEAYSKKVPDLNELSRLRKMRESQVAEFEKDYLGQGVSKETIKVWRMHRDAYDAALDKLLDPMRELLEKIREESAFKGEDESNLADFMAYRDDKGQVRKLSLKEVIAEMEEWRGFYAPRMREQGDWVVRSKKGNTYYRYHKPTRYQAERLGSKLEMEGHRVEKPFENPKPPESLLEHIKAMDAAKLLEHASEKTGRDNIDAALKFREELLRQTADMIRARGFRSTMIHRKRGDVVKGYIEDPAQRFVQYINNLSGGLSKARTAADMTEAFLGKWADGQRVGGIDAVKEPRAHETARSYIEEQLRNAELADRVIGTAKTVATFKYLGLPNIRAPFVNLTAMVTTVPAAIHEYVMQGKGPFREIGSALLKAGQDYTRYMTGKKLTLVADEQRFLDEIKRLGYDDPQYTRDALGTIQKLHGRLFAKTMQKSMWLFGKTEQWNRGATMLAAYRIAKRRKIGRTDADRMDLARKVTEKAHGIYGRATLPAWAQGRNPAAKVGQLLYVYQKFGHNWLQMLYDLGVKRRNAKAFIWAMASPVVLGGAAAMPFKGVAVALVGYLLKSTGDDRDPEKMVFDGLRRHLGVRGEKVVRYGAVGALGGDISGSFAFDPGVPKNLWDWAGPIGGVAQDIKQALRFIETGQPARALEAALPRGAANLITAFREKGQGARTRSGARIWDETGRILIPDNRDTVLRLLGFRSSRRAALQARQWETRRQQKRFRDRLDKIYEKYRAYLAAPSEKLHKEVMREIDRYNRNLLDSDLAGTVPFITRRALKAQARNMARPRKAQRAYLR